MDGIFLFHMNALDKGAVRSQVSCAMEEWTHLASGKRDPKEKSQVRALRAAEKACRKRQAVLGLLDWGLGAVLLTFGALHPGTRLLPLLIGAVCFAAGVGVLWRTRRTLLGALSVLLAGGLCLGAWWNLNAAVPLFLLGIAVEAVGVAALLTGEGQEALFDRAAEQLLRGRAGTEGLEQVQVAFSSAGMTLGDREERHTYPYSRIAYVLETDDLILPMYDGCVLILQKSDLMQGTMPELRTFLAGQLAYVMVG